MLYTLFPPDDPPIPGEKIRVSNPRRGKRWLKKEEELVVGAVFICGSIKNEDPPNAYQAQHEPNPRFDESIASVHPYSTVVP